MIKRCEVSKPGNQVFVESDQKNNDERRGLVPVINELMTGTQLIINLLMGKT